MNYVRIILVTTILLYTYNLNNAELLIPDEQQEAIEPLTTDEQAIQPTIIEQTEEIQEQDDVTQWNDHLALLTIKGEYWDAADNIATPDWQTTAFKLGEMIAIKDANLAEMLKTSFFDAISAKVLLETKAPLKMDSSAFRLTQEFNQMIQDVITPPVVELPEEVEPILSPTVTSEIIEPEPAPTTELPSISQPESTTTAETTAAPATEQPAENFEQQWDDQLKKIKSEGQDEYQFNALLTQAYELASKLRQADPTKESTLQAQFRDALEARRYTAGEKFRNFNVEQEMMNFNNALGIFSPEQYSYNESYYPSSEEMGYSDEALKIKQEMDEKFAQQQEKIKQQQADLAKRQEEEKKEIMQMKASLIQAQKEGTIDQEQLRSALQLQKEQEKKLAEKIAELEKQSQEAREQYKQQIAMLSKTAAAPTPTPEAKGMFSGITDTVYNWWYGVKPEENAPSMHPTEKEKEKILTQMMLKTKDPNGAMIAFKEFENILVSFDLADYLGKEVVFPAWIEKMKKSVESIVLEYEIMPLKEVNAIITQFLQALGRIPDFNITQINNKIGESVRKIEAKKEHEKAQEEKRKQKVRDQKEEKARAQQIIKNEQLRIEAEEKKRIEDAHLYKTTYDQWGNLLRQISEDVAPSKEQNNAYTMEALQKAGLLLQLTDETENKLALSQKLKQEFSLAFLEQYKRTGHELNIHHLMQVFNNAINKIME